MARIARVALSDIPYHITHRGNHRADIFFKDEDRDVYQALLQEYCNRYRLEIWAQKPDDQLHLLDWRRPESELPVKDSSAKFEEKLNRLLHPGATQFMEGRNMKWRASGRGYGSLCADGDIGETLDRKHG